MKKKIITFTIILLRIYIVSGAAVQKYNSPHGNNVYTVNTPVDVILTSDTGANESYTLTDSIGKYKKSFPSKKNTEPNSRKKVPFIRPGHTGVGFYLTVKDSVKAMAYKISAGIWY